uniref:Impact N-terminal domain-containing protein n=1 Tax=Mycena chlorophos TaxID=658473 RepID=A0ABQ0M3P1_MYCCL|nr:predicted protein [Mycena chlorophos]
MLRIPTDWPHPIYSSARLTLRKSVFLAHASTLSEPDALPQLLSHLRASEAKKATHCMYAFRAANKVEGQADGGESGSGDRLARLLQLSSSQDVVVVVWRWIAQTVFRTWTFPVFRRASWAKAGQKIDAMEREQLLQNIVLHVDFVIRGPRIVGDSFKRTRYKAIVPAGVPEDRRVFSSKLVEGVEDLGNKERSGCMEGSVGDERVAGPQISRNFLQKRPVPAIRRLRCWNRSAIHEQNLRLPRVAQPERVLKADSGAGVDDRFGVAFIILGWCGMERGGEHIAHETGVRRNERLVLRYRLVSGLGGRVAWRKTDMVESAMIDSWTFVCFVVVGTESIEPQRVEIIRRLRADEKYTLGAQERTRTLDQIGFKTEVAR